MTVNATIRNQEAVAALLKKLSGPQAKAAYAKAVNDAAFQVRREMQAALRKSFDRVTPWIERSPKVFAATPDKLSAYVAPTHDTRNAPSRGGGRQGKEGVDPQKILQAQEFGGPRRDKKSEAVLRRSDWLPEGYQTAIPKTPFPGSEDGFGNIKGNFIREVLSYLQMFNMAGADMNMRKAAKKRLNEFGRSNITKKAQQQAGPFMGRRYFVAGARSHLATVAVGGRVSIKRVSEKSAPHLQPGIWGVIGRGRNAQLRPVLIFVRAPTYRPRISMDAIAAKVDVQDYLDKRVRFRIREAAGV